MRLRLFASLTVLSLLLALPALAQEAPFNITEVGNFDQAGQTYADIWGDGNFAYVGHFNQNRISIMDMTNPANPTLAATYTSSSGSAQDVKVANGLMFVGIENGNPGAQIVDVRDPYNPQQLTNVTVRRNIHNLFYDDGWLYLVDSSNNQIDIVDLRGYDPDNAPGTISNEAWTLTNVGNQFVHDITVQNGRMYASAWDSIRVYDITGNAFQPPQFLGSASGSSVHAAWATDDGRFVAVAEERGGGGVTLYEITDNGGSVTLSFRDNYFVDSSRASSAHNPVILGNRVYVSWYEAGVQVLEIDPVNANWALVGSFDTTALNGNNSFFGGNWGVYPLLGEDKVIASDQSNGLYVLDVDPNVLTFSYPTGQPSTLLPSMPTPLQVQIGEVGAPVDPTSVVLSAAINGVPQADVSMTDLGGGIFEGDIPGALCGEEVEWVIRAENISGGIFVDPPTGESYSADVATGIRRSLEDTFESNMGWTVANFNLDTGAWERGNPNGSGAQPEDDFVGDAGAQCFFTDQGPVGGGSGDADVDGGPTELTSPSIDLSAGDGVLRYAYWFFNDDGDDSLTVEISDGGAGWIEAKRYTGGGGGWEEDQIDVDDFLPPTSDLRVRFSTSDNPNDSVTEAAIDFVRADTILCDPAGTPLTLSQTDLVSGQPATLTVTGANTNETVYYVLSAAGTGIGTCPPALGNLCLGLVSPIQFVGTAMADGSGTAELTLNIPSGMDGLVVHTQAVSKRGVGGADSVNSNTVSAPILP